MKVEVAQLWVDALRSDEFTQGNDRLKTVSSDGQVRHCCLGVLCEIAIRSGLNVTESPPQPENEEEPHCSVVHFAGSSGYLPQVVCDWAGAGGRDISLTYRDAWGVPRSATASKLNDTDKFTFTQIADAIEYTYLTDHNIEYTYLTDHKADGVGPS